MTCGQGLEALQDQTVARGLNPQGSGLGKHLQPDAPVRSRDAFRGVAPRRDGDDPCTAERRGPGRYDDRDLDLFRHDEIEIRSVRALHERDDVELGLGRRLRGERGDLDRAGVKARDLEAALVVRPDLRHPAPMLHRPGHPTDRDQGSGEGSAAGFTARLGLFEPDTPDDPGVGKDHIDPGSSGWARLDLDRRELDASWIVTAPVAGMGRGEHLDRPLARFRKPAVEPPLVVGRYLDAADALRGAEDEGTDERLPSRTAEAGSSADGDMGNRDRQVLVRFDRHRPRPPTTPPGVLDVEDSRPWAQIHDLRPAGGVDRLSVRRSSSAPLGDQRERPRLTHRVRRRIDRHLEGGGDLRNETR